LAQAVPASARYLKFLALNDTPAFVKLIGRVLEQEFKDERVKVAGHTH
jgi:hypothetical protein